MASNNRNQVVHEGDRLFFDHHFVQLILHNNIY